MKVAVMAGTLVDTKIGASLLKENKLEKNNSKIKELEIIEIPISKNPAEQTIFQSMDNEYKEEILTNHIEQIQKKGCNILFVYCNSLSGSVDFLKLANKNNIKIITPLDIYLKLANCYNKVAVISANAKGLSGIENVMFKSNKNIEIIGITLLEIVKDIEKNIKPDKIIEKFKLYDLISYLESQKVEIIVLGCTHFPYIKDEITKLTNLKIIDPSMEMVEMLKKSIQFSKNNKNSNINLEIKLKLK